MKTLGWVKLKTKITQVLWTYYNNTGDCTGQMRDGQLFSINAFSLPHETIFSPF